MDILFNKVHLSIIYCTKFISKYDSKSNLRESIHKKLGGPLYRTLRPLPARLIVASHGGRDYMGVYVDVKLRGQ